MAVHLKALLDKTQLLHPNEVEDQTCPICYDDYLQDQSREFPRKLPWGHIIGTECLLLWASAQNGATSVKCPWCTKPIINSLGAKQFIEICMSYAQAAIEQAIAVMERRVTAVDLEFRKRNVEVVAAAILLVVLGAYLNTALAWLPLRVLYWCVKLTTKHHLVGHRRLGLLFIGIGFCVGEFVHRDSGHDLVSFGKIAYRDSMLRIYSDHPWLVLGGTLGIYMVLSALSDPVGGMIRTEVGLQFIGCVVYLIVTWMMR